jgi:hypothetical protein
VSIWATSIHRPQSHPRKCEICSTMFEYRPLVGARINAPENWRCADCRRPKEPRVKAKAARVRLEWGKR